MAVAVKKSEKQSDMQVVKKVGQTSDQNNNLSVYILNEQGKQVDESGNTILSDEDLKQVKLNQQIENVDRYIKKVAKDYMAIAWSLNEIKNNELYSVSPKNDFYKFCDYQWHFCKTTVKNMLRVHAIFSDGISKIDDDYKDYSYSQLVEMSAIDKKYWERITPKSTIKEIRAIKMLEEQDKQTLAPVEKVSKPKSKKETKEEFLERYCLITKRRLVDIDNPYDYETENSAHVAYGNALSKIIEIMNDEKDLMLL